MAEFGPAFQETLVNEGFPGFSSKEQYMKHILAALILTYVAITPCYSADIKPALKATFAHEGGYQAMRGDRGFRWVGGI